jgi:glucosamine 6-phosphate synthetase-like amidotransferase/phosphosugar isomerase protein
MLMVLHHICSATIAVDHYPCQASDRLSREHEVALMEAPRQLPAILSRALRVEPQIKTWAETFSGCEHALFLGRGNDVDKPRNLARQNEMVG